MLLGKRLAKATVTSHFKKGVCTAHHTNIRLHSLCIPQVGEGRGFFGGEAGGGDWKKFCRQEGGMPVVLDAIERLNICNITDKPLHKPKFLKLQFNEGCLIINALNCNVLYFVQSVTSSICIIIITARNPIQHGCKNHYEPALCPDVRIWLRKDKGRRGEKIYFAFCGINARNSMFPIIKIDKVKFEPYFNRQQCGEKLVLDGGFDDNLQHKIATLSSQYL